MKDENFEMTMKVHSDEKLIDVLKKRNKYQDKAVEAAIKEVINRKLILNSNELDIKFPIVDEEQEITKKELLDLFENKIDFQESTTILYIIGICTGLLIVITYSLLPTVPIIYLGLVYFCSKYYNNTLAKVINWIAIFQVGAVILYIISRLIRLFI